MKTDSNAYSEVTITFGPATDSPEIICRDGEVQSGWPQEDTSDDGNQDDTETDPPQYQTIVEVEKGDILASLPKDARLLCIHSSTLFEGWKYIALTSDNRILVGDSANPADVRVAAVWDEAYFGTLSVALPRGLIVTIVGSKATAWLVRDAEGAYTFRPSLPSAPECSVSLYDAALEPYILTEESDAALTVETSLKGTGITYEQLEAWIDHGTVHGISRAVREEIRSAVADKFEAYLEAAYAAGFTTSPIIWAASRSGRLPSHVARIGTFATPLLIIDSWNMADDILHLSLYCTLRPQYASAFYTIDADEAAWSDFFPRLEVYASRGVRWWETPVSGACASSSRRERSFKISEMKNITHRDEQHRGFQVVCATAAELAVRVENEAKLRIAGSIAADRAQTGMFRLRLSDTGDIFTPDYNDFRTPSGSTGCVTDEGFVICRGAEVLSSHPDYPVLYPHSLTVGDTAVAGVVTALQSRSASPGGITPLTLFSGDGIRLLASDGHGAYGISRLISRDALSTQGGVTAADAAAACITTRGLMEISGTKRTLLSVDLPDTVTESPQQLAYSYRDDIYLLCRKEDAHIFDKTTGKWIDLTFRLGNPINIDGETAALDEDNRLVTIRILRKQVLIADTEEADGDASEGTYGDDSETVSESAYEAASADTGVATETPTCYLTRALKFGAWWQLKRIGAVYPDEGTEKWVLESSDDLEHWATEMSGSTPRRGLRMGAHRYWRVRLYPHSRAGAPQTRIYSLICSVKKLEIL